MLYKVYIYLKIQVKWLIREISYNKINLKLQNKWKRYPRSMSYKGNKQKKKCFVNESIKLFNNFQNTGNDGTMD